MLLFDVLRRPDGNLTLQVQDGRAKSFRADIVFSREEWKVIQAKVEKMMHPSAPMSTEQALDGVRYLLENSSVNGLKIVLNPFGFVRLHAFIGIDWLDSFFGEVRDKVKSLLGGEKHVWSDRDIDDFNTSLAQGLAPMEPEAPTAPALAAPATPTKKLPPAPTPKKSEAKATKSRKR